MAKVTISSRKLNAGLAELVKRLEDATPAFRDISDRELSATKLRFRDEKDPDGGLWPDPITIRRDGGAARRTQGLDPWAYVIASNYHATPIGWHFFDRARGDKVLRDTGTLFNSIGRDFGKNFALVGTNIEYSKKLQNGRFPFLGINRKTEENVRVTLESYISGALK